MNNARRSNYCPIVCPTIPAFFSMTAKYVAHSAAAEETIRLTGSTQQCDAAD